MPFQTSNPYKAKIVLFSGKNNAEKIIAADVIANELMLNIYRIDFPSIMSKYIGETEKHLEKLFDMDLGIGAILFFDEAEALFDKRTKVKDAHDRYSKIDTNYLLGRLETFNGIVILTINLNFCGEINADQALYRHIHYIVEFPPLFLTSVNKSCRFVLPDLLYCYRHYTSSNHGF